MYGALPVSGVKVPVELLSSPPNVLEDYVRSRLRQFVGIFNQKLLQLVPAVHADAFDRSVNEALLQTPQPDYGSVPLDFKELQLVFRHDCM